MEYNESDCGTLYQWLICFNAELAAAEVDDEEEELAELGVEAVEVESPLTCFNLKIFARQITQRSGRTYNNVNKSIENVYKCKE